MSKPVAVVVGAGPGLGSALARRFAVAGMAVAVARRRIDELAGLAEETGGRAYACDATEGNSVEALFDSVEHDLGTPALVAYNAGAYQRGGILEISAEDFERCWRIGCLGGFHVGQAAARRMVPAGQGTILFTGATASLRGSAGFMNLAMPKFGPACGRPIHGARARSQGRPRRPRHHRRPDCRRAARLPARGAGRGRGAGAVGHRGSLLATPRAAEERLDPRAGPQALDREVLDAPCF